MRDHTSARPIHATGDTGSGGPIDLDELVAAGLVPDGQLQVSPSTWFVYGHAAYDGEVVLARYEDAATAIRALQGGV